MNELIERLAREAGIEKTQGDFVYGVFVRGIRYDADSDALEAFARAVARLNRVNCTVSRPAEELPSA